MDEQEVLAQHFEEHRTRLRAVAYRMLGSLTEADDAVQETWLRLSRVDADEVENLRGWLTTVVARVSLNMLRSRRSRREEPLELRMPDPIVDRADGTDPEHEALYADAVGLALLVVQDRVEPRCRSASSSPPRRAGSTMIDPLLGPSERSRAHETDRGARGVVRICVPSHDANPGHPSRRRRSIRTGPCFVRGK